METMDYDWDSRKAKSNLAKHGVAFADAVAVFSDESAITIEDEHSGEQRFVTRGMDGLGRVLVVAYTWREVTIRIISARKATERERRLYGGER